MNIEDAIGVGAGFLLGVVFHIVYDTAKSWYNRRKVKKIIGAWLEDKRAVLPYVLLESMGVANNDLDLIFKASILSNWYVDRDGSRNYGLGITRERIDEVDEILGRKRRRQKRRKPKEAVGDTSP